MSLGTNRTEPTVPASLLCEVRDRLIHHRYTLADAERLVGSHRSLIEKLYRIAPLPRRALCFHIARQVSWAEDARDRQFRALFVADL